MFFINPCVAGNAAILAGRVGYIDTPAQGAVRPPGVEWCADNGAYSDRFDEVVWWRWLQIHAPEAGSCWFATAPDVVGDAAATLQRSAPWLPRIRELGFPAAFVAQDGQENLPVPWNDFDVLFIGGRKTPDPRDEWKRGPHARRLVAEAVSRGKRVHFGRINSGRMYRYVEAVGGHSCDGTYVIYGPDKNVPKLLTWVDQPSLFGAT